MTDLNLLEGMIRDPGVSWASLVASARGNQANLEGTVKGNLPHLLPALVAKKSAGIATSHHQAKVDASIPVVEQAVKRAGLNPLGASAANAYRLITAVMIELGSTKLPYGCNAAIQAVLTAQGCLPPASSCLRFYRHHLLKDPAQVDAAFGLPDGWQTMVTHKS